jgi:uncharacterized membrane protein YdfJ with MMPL/SSD domain
MATLPERFLAPIRARPRAVLLAYFLVFLALLWPAAHFTAETDSSFTAPASAESAEATRKYNELYSSSGSLAAIVLLAGSNLTTTLLDDLSLYSSDLAAQAADLSSSCASQATLTSYYSFLDASLPSLAANFASPSGDETFLYISYKCAETSSFTTDLLNYATKTSPYLPAAVSAGVTGIEYFQEDTLAGVESDLSTMDSFILPLSLVILGLVLGSLSIMVIPVCTIVVTIVFR